MAAGSATIVSVAATGGQPPYTLQSLHVDGTAHPVSAGSLQASLVSSVMGRHDVTAVLRDSQGATVTAQDWYAVTDPLDADEPVARISSPGDSADIVVADVTEPAAILGQATDSHFAEYELLISAAGQNQWNRLKRGNAPVAAGGELGRLHPQALANGLYDIALIVRDTAGKEASARISVAISGQQKAAPLRLAFEDLSFDIEGLPLQVVRTYDSLRRHEALDFGYGWSVQYQDVAIQTNGIVGRSWSAEQSGAGFGRKICIRPAGSRVVAVRLPGGRLEQFEARAEPECVSLIQWASNPSAHITYRPRGRGHSGASLEALGSWLDLRIVGGQLTDYGSGETYNPTQWKYTTREGVEFILDGSRGLAGGIQQIKDRQGNTMQFAADGIRHSGGWSLRFERDAQKRITRITGPGGVQRRYSYDAAGNLAAAIEPDGAQAAYGYEDTSQPHALTRYSDPAGRLQLKAEYDSQGRVIKQTDALGQSVSISHQDSQRRQSVKDRLGHTTVYDYDERGNVTQITDALGGITRYQYDANDNETAVTDPLGRTTRREYDAYGNVTRETDPLGRQSSTVYDASGNVTEQRQPGGLNTLYSYSGAGELASLTQPGGGVSHLNYTPKGSLLSLSDPLGRATRYGYALTGGASQLASQTAPDGAKTTYTRDAQGRISAQSTAIRLQAGQAAQEAQSRTAHDAQGRITAQTDPLGHITRSDYNAAGELIKQTSPLGLATVHRHDALGRTVRTEHPDGLIDTWAWDSEGRQTKHCEAASGANSGLCTQTRYDALGRAIETVDAAGGISRNQYDAAGQLTESQDALGRKTRYEYDAAGRIVKTTDPLGHSQRTAYSEAGQIASITAADGKQTAYDYDSAGRKVRTHWPGGAVSSAAYDAAGQKTADTDETGHSQRYAYDSAGRLSQTTQPSGAATRYEWNEAGQLLSQTDALGRTTQYGYDLGGRRTSRRLPDGSQETNTHDADGRLVQKRQTDGTAISYSYSQGRATGQTRPDGTLQIGYDPHGRAASWSDSQRGLIQQTLDALDRQTSETGPHGQSAAAWDAASQRTQLIASFAGQGGHTLQTRWDAGGRLQSLASGQGSAQFSHDAAGRLSQIKRANGASSHYSYDAAGRLAQIRHQKTDGSALAQYSYQRDAKGRLTRATEETGGQTTNKSWEYDADGKLTQESISAAGITRTCRYSYDSTGNRTEKDCDGQKTRYAYNSLDQLTEEQTATGPKTTYRWDGRGNLLEKRTPAQTIRYEWSSDNRLLKASDGSTSIRYGYDALGRRISRTRETGGQKQETQWILDTARPYSEIVLERNRQNGGAWQETRYTHTPDGVGQLISEQRQGQTLHVYEDGQGSARLITDEGGQIIETLDFDAFGNEEAGNLQESRHRYTGESYDSATGLYHLRARDYDPKTGRFISMDEHPGSQSIPLTLNKYLYGNADPVNHVDPGGNFSLGGMMSGIGNMASMMAMSWIRMEVADMFSSALLSPIIEAAVNSVSHSGQIPSFGNSGIAMILTGLAGHCRISKNKCYLRIPTMVNGFQTFYTSQHILDSLMGNGDTISGISKPLPFLLLRGPKSRKNEVKYSTRNASQQCNNTARAKYLGTNGMLISAVCDEYPYGSTLQGGDINYFFDSVSLRLVPSAEGPKQGGLLSKFYSATKVNTIGKPFLNLAVPYAPGFYIDKYGKASWL